MSGGLRINCNLSVCVLIIVYCFILYFILYVDAIWSYDHKTERITYLLTYSQLSYRLQML